MTPEVLYHDNHLLAANKPAGLPTQRAPAAAECLEEWVRDWIKNRYSKPGRAFAEPVHRLDRPVSGLVLFARTSKALSRLAAAIRQGEWQKRYYAVVAPPPAPAEDVLSDYLAHGSHQARVTTHGAPGAKAACLRYRTLAIEHGLALLEVRPETGRYHQIRVQLAHIGCPILGDRRYGGSAAADITNTIALHHGQLHFTHPVQRVPLILTASVPAAWPWTVGNIYAAVNTALQNQQDNPPWG